MSNERLERQIKEIITEIETLSHKGDFDTAIAKGNEAFLLAVETNLFQHQISALYQIAIQYFYKVDYTTSIDYSNRALVLTEKTGIIELEAQIHNILALAYKRMGLYEKSLQHLYKALELAEKDNDKEGIAMITCNIGGTYSYLRYSDKALKYCKKALKLSKEIGDTHCIYFCIQNIGSIYFQEKDFKKSLRYAKQCLHLSEQNGFLAEITRNLNNLGVCYNNMGFPEKAIQFYKKAIKHSFASNALEQRAYAHIYMAELYVDKKRYRDAKDCLEQANQTIDLEKCRDLHIKYLKSCANVYAGIDDFKNAYDYHKKFSELNSETYTEENLQKIVNIEKSFELREKEREAEIYRLKNVDLVKVNQQLERVNKDLSEANKQLQIAHESKDNILRIVSHDLRNVITVVSQTLELARYQELSEKMGKYLSTMDLATNRAIQLVKDILEANEIETPDFKLVLHPIKIDEYLERFFDIFNQSCEQKKIRFVVDLRAGNTIAYINPDKLWQILYNLIHNAIKFTHEGGKITLRTELKLHKSATSKHKDWLLIKVIDNGIGISEEQIPHLFDKFTKAKRKGTAGESTTGIGLSIVKRLTELHNGDIVVKSKIGKGTEFCIKLPIHTEKM